MLNMACDVCRKKETMTTPTESFKGWHTFARPTITYHLCPSCLESELVRIVYKAERKFARAKAARK